MHAPDVTSNSGCHSQIYENDKEREFLCVDGKVHAYTQEQLARLSETLLANINYISSSTYGSDSIQTTDPQIVEEANRLIREELNLWPKTIKENVFLGCTCFYAPKLEIEASLLEPMLPDDSTSLFPSAIGLCYTMPTDVSMDFFGVILTKGSTICIKQNMENLLNIDEVRKPQEIPGRSLTVNKTLYMGVKPGVMKQMEAEVCIGDEKYNKKILRVNLRDGQVFIEIPLFEVKGVIDATGEAYLENGIHFCFEDTVTSPNFFIGVSFLHEPHIVAGNEKEVKD